MAEALEEVVDPDPERGRDRGQPVGRQQAGAGLVLVGLLGADPEQAGQLVPGQAELEPASAQAGGDVAVDLAEARPVGVVAVAGTAPSGSGPPGRRAGRELLAKILYAF